MDKRGIRYLGQRYNLGHLPSPPRRDPMGLGKDYDMSQYITEEDIERELAKMMEKFRGEAT